MVVSGYINNSACRFHVQQIHDSTKPSEWFHVQGENNPAYKGSRGMSAMALVKEARCLSGPEFLHAIKFQMPTSMSVSDAPLDEDGPGVKVTGHCTVSPNDQFPSLVTKLVNCLVGFMCR